MARRSGVHVRIDDRDRAELKSMARLKSAHAGVRGSHVDLIRVAVKRMLFASRDDERLYCAGCGTPVAEGEDNAAP